MLPQRKPPRLAEYDYNSPGAYFITVCTDQRRNLFSCIVGAIHESPVLQLTPCGRIVEDVLLHLPEHLGVRIDQYVIMPNHIHLIVVIRDRPSARAIHESPLQGRSVLSKTIGYLKMNVSKRIHREIGIQNIWQRSFYDHIIRDEADYQKIWRYIETNVLRWEKDRFYNKTEM